MVEKNKVSIIIPVYNGEKTIYRAIKSCLNQSYKNLEILVINNESTDRTEEIIYEFKDNRIKLFSSKKGRSIARNIGLSHSNGDYIVFLDADDTLSKKSVENATCYLSDNPNCFAYAFSIDYVNEKTGEVINNDVPEYKNNSDLEKFNPFPINSIVFRNEVDIKFDETLEYNEDWLFFATLLNNKEIFLDNNFKGGTVYIHENNTMSNIEEMVGNQLIVRNKIRIINKRKSYKKVTISNLKLLILYNLLEDKSDLKTDLRNEYGVMYYCSVFICHLPLTSFFLRKKLLNFKNKYNY